MLIKYQSVFYSKPCKYGEKAKNKIIPFLSKIPKKEVEKITDLFII